jgi:hypothetical protein
MACLRVLKSPPLLLIHLLFSSPEEEGKEENEKIEKRGRLGRARLYQHPLGEKKTREEGVVYAV